MKKIFLIGLILVSLLFTAEAITIIEVDYDSSFNNAEIYETDSVVLRIKTSERNQCFYGISESEKIPFDGEYGIIHEVYLNNLEEGPHTYYVSCGSGQANGINFSTKIPIFATIEMDNKNSQLGEGKYKITLTTSKPSSGIPKLEYSFDETNYKTISLAGNGKNWEGNLIISEDVGESVCSFRFSAVDISGGYGNKISGESSFVVDTIKPETINTIEAIGYNGQIRLKWFSDENIEKFNIYRSEISPVSYMDFYEETDNEDYFYDNDVGRGKTYYYKVEPVDDAGNAGDLSMEVYATALLKNSSSAGLNPKFIGKVDNLITEINSISENIDNAQDAIESEENKEKEIFEEIKLNKEIENSLSELNSIKRDVEGYKLQDLSETEIDKKISSAELKLNIIKKKVPESIMIVNEKTISRNLNEENIRKAFLEYYYESEYDYEKDLSETIKTTETNKIKAESSFYNIEITYLDGTKKEITLIEEEISSDAERETPFILIVPKEIAETSSEIKVVNSEYEVIKEDPILLFKKDTEKIIYYINEEIELDSLVEIIFSPIKIESSETGKSLITGNVVSDWISDGSWGIVVLILFVSILGLQLMKMKNDSSIKPVLVAMQEISRVKKFLKEGKDEEAKESYGKVKEIYKTLSAKEKSLIAESIKTMNEGTGK